MTNDKNDRLEVVIIGAGDRGKDTYGAYASEEGSPIKVVGVVDPETAKLEEMGQRHNIPPERLFKTLDDFLDSTRFCDNAINATPDRFHHDTTISLLRKGYNILLEKPIANNPQDCSAIVDEQKKAGKVLSVAHVLRYAPFFKEIKKIIDRGDLGKLLHINLTEHVGYWHFAHSYVRGNWHKEETSGPVILTKSCHDLDMLCWLIGGKVSSLSSYGALHHFKAENRPEGAAENCLDCKVDCPYDAKAFYLTEQDSSKVIWPPSVISTDKSIEGRQKALREGPYGRCVYTMDNDVCDSQTVMLQFDSGATAQFYLAAHTDQHSREIQLFFSKGRIYGYVNRGRFEVTKFGGGSIDKGNYDRSEYDKITTWEGGSKEDHGGADGVLVKAFADAVRNNNPNANLTTAEMSLQSHMLAFAAEFSRKNNGQRVDMKQYMHQFLKR
ncbi:Gfo/Idh/MocA family oxidoreductase [Candidatus Woesearchaeota archaeon]|nr:Gfo/Idh/MocA family oxidoreductase [Candidatus Woesearchaeota archaeon]